MNLIHDAGLQQQPNHLSLCLLPASLPLTQTLCPGSRCILSQERSLLFGFLHSLWVMGFAPGLGCCLTLSTLLMLTTWLSGLGALKTLQRVPSWFSEKNQAGECERLQRDWERSSLISMKKYRPPHPDHSQESGPNARYATWHWQIELCRSNRVDKDTPFT